MNTLREALDKLEEAKEMLSKAIQNSLQPESILSVKCAIQGSNEREFKLLMEHYEAKGWKWLDGHSPTDWTPEETRCGVYPILISFEDGFHYTVSNEIEDCKTINFESFASEFGIKVPVFIMKSEDGVDLFEGDSYWRAGRCKPNATGDFVVFETEDLKSCHFVCCYPDTDKAFSTRKSAEEWIKEQNKPKEFEVEFQAGSLLVKSDRIEINGTVRVISREMLLDIIGRQGEL